MTALVQQLEEMRMRMNEQAQQESNLVAVLADALRARDRQLLHDVRRLTTEHEARRAAILSELQVLASQLNAFPVPGQAVASLGSTARGLLSAGVAETGHPGHGSADGEQRSGDIRDALNKHLNTRSLRG